MTATALGIAAAALVVWRGLISRPAVERLRALGPAVVAPRSIEDGGPLAGLGYLVWRLWSRLSHNQTPQPDRRSCTQIGRAAVAVPLVIVVGGLAWGALLGIALGVLPVLARRSAEKTRLRSIERELPLVVELYGIAIRSGLNITMATRAVARRADGPIADALSHAVDQVDKGRRIADALEDVIGHTSDSARPLIHGLLSAERYGAALADTLDRLALEYRAAEIRRAERTAKRLAITLLFPVAGCTLPAFALLTVAPLLAGSLGSLALSFN